ncbi:pentatricopeptide repeat-containing protein At4g38150-like isoform X2 [Lotus japonicus]|nr:pentatricopeptide repeat-containing protein At4g38150-like isoform X2 [Lotus japonicus]
MPALLRRVHKPVSSSQMERLVSLLNSKQPVRHFSFTDDCSGDIKQLMGESDDVSIHKLDPHFSDSSREGSEPIPNRALRGTQPVNPHSREYNRGSRSSRPRFDGNRGRPDDVEMTNKSSQTDIGFQGRNMSDTNKVVNKLGDSFLDKFKLGFDNKAGNSSEVAASNLSEEAKSANSNQPAMPEDADEIFKKMKETGLIPNAVAMLDGLCKDGLVQEALKLFGLMREKGTIPEIVIYTAVVEGYTKAHKADDAKRIFRKMQSNGISPNAFSYTVLVQGLCKCSRLQDAFEFCVEMLEAGHSPNMTTFVDLVDGFVKEQGVAEAKGAIRTLIEKGFVVNEKAVKGFLDMKKPFSPSVWEAIFGKKAPQMPF